MKRKIGLVAIALLGTAMTPSAPAQAALSGCSSWYTGANTIVQGYCTTFYHPPIKPDAYRARGRHAVGGAWKNGPWKGPALVSEVAADPGRTFVQKSLEMI